MAEPGTSTPLKEPAEAQDAINELLRLLQTPGVPFSPLGSMQVGPRQQAGPPAPTPEQLEQFAIPASLHSPESQDLQQRQEAIRFIQDRLAGIELGEEEAGQRGLLERLQLMKQGQPVQPVGAQEVLTQVEQFGVDSPESRTLIGAMPEPLRQEMFALMGRQGGLGGALAAGFQELGAGLAGLGVRTVEDVVNPKTYMEEVARKTGSEAVAFAAQQQPDIIPADVLPSVGPTELVGRADEVAAAALDDLKVRYSRHGISQIADRPLDYAFDVFDVGGVVLGAGAITALARTKRLGQFAALAESGQLKKAAELARMTRNEAGFLRFRAGPKRIWHRDGTILASNNGDEGRNISSLRDGWQEFANEEYEEIADNSLSGREINRAYQKRRKDLVDSLKRKEYTTFVNHGPAGDELVQDAKLTRERLDAAYQEVSHLNPTVMTMEEVLAKGSDISSETRGTLKRYLSSVAKTHLSDMGLSAQAKLKPKRTTLSDGKIAWTEQAWRYGEDGSIQAADGNRITIEDPKRRREIEVLKERDPNVLARENATYQALNDWRKLDPANEAGFADIRTRLTATGTDPRPLIELQELRRSGALDTTEAFNSAQAQMLSWATNGRRTFDLSERQMHQARTLADGIDWLHPNVSEGMIDLYATRYRLPAYVTEAIFSSYGDRRTPFGTLVGGQREQFKLKPPLELDSPDLIRLGQKRATMAAMLDKRTLPQDPDAMGNLLDKVGRMMREFPDTWDKKHYKRMWRNRALEKLPIPEAEAADRRSTWNKMTDWMGIPRSNFWQAMFVGMDSTLKRMAPVAGTDLVRRLENYFYDQRAYANQMYNRFLDASRGLSPQDRDIARRILEGQEIPAISGAREARIRNAAAQYRQILDEVWQDSRDVGLDATAKGEPGYIENYFPRMFEWNEEIAKQGADSFLRSLNPDTTFGDLAPVEGVRTNLLAYIYGQENPASAGVYHQTYFKSDEMVASAIRQGASKLGQSIDDVQVIRLMTGMKRDPNQLSEAVRLISAAPVNSVPSMTAVEIYKNAILNRGHMISRHLELPRKADEQAYIKDPLKAFAAYARESARRITAAQQFGPDLRELNLTLRQIEMEGGNHDFALSMVNRILGREQPARLGETGIALGRNFAAITFLGLAGVQNMTQFNFSAFRTNYDAARKALGTYLGGLRSPEDRAVMLRMINDSGAVPFVKEHKLRMRDALFSDLMDEFYRDYIGTGSTDNWLSQKSNEATRAFLKSNFFVASERSNRILGGLMGQEYLKDMVNRVLANEGKGAKGQRKANRAMRELRDLIDGPDEPLADELVRLVRDRSGQIDDIAEIGKDVGWVGERAKTRAILRVIDETQFGVSGQMKLPFFWAGPYGGLMAQFKTFGFQSSKLFYSELKRDRKRFAKSFLPFYAIAGPQGAAVNYILDSINGRETEEDMIGAIAGGVMQLGVYGLWANLARTLTNKMWPTSNLVIPPSISPWVKLAEAVGAGFGKEEGEYKRFTDAEKAKIWEEVLRMVPAPFGVTRVIASRSSAKRFKQKGGGTVDISSGGSGSSGGINLFGIKF